ncbi:isochorismatase [Phormidium tenue]|uniref:Isochorismatase n=1 Tax=Phormidium tenue NIES-30 TaxID=549789 RepID=A0A1U7J081_9CYAN|nr:isochorismatase [Phormidium tenue]MBD2234372.1 isochorismatase [Phormidium tenue FACHB-1052]OKH45011.1 isochorismatase [Phormidium tenue NIES-30]
MTDSALLPVPDFYNPSRVGEVWSVPYQQRAAEAKAWAKAHRIAPAAEDSRRLCLLLIDVQNTFCIPGFELFVGGRSGQGAVDDNRRLSEFIYRNLGQITTITATLDTHQAMQVFHPAFWVDAEGENPPPMTMIHYDDVVQGKWRVNPAIAANLTAPRDLQEYALHYTKTLDDRGKYPLTIWPYHSMLGGIGHALVPAIEEACFFHTIARQSQTRFELKGSNPLTENYSVLSPEVMEDGQGQAIAQKNSPLIQTLLEFDGVIVAGQAKSHCVAWTVADLLSDIEATDPALAQKVYLLDDCASAVVVPGVVDFTDQAEDTYQRFAEAGMHRVQSTTAIADWP